MADVTLTALLIFLERIQDPTLKEMAFEFAKVDVERAVFVLGKCDLLTDACLIEEVGNFYKHSDESGAIELYQMLQVPRSNKSKATAWFNKYRDALT